MIVTKQSHGHVNMARGSNDDTARRTKFAFPVELSSSAKAIYMYTIQSDLRAKLDVGWMRCIIAPAGLSNGNNADAIVTHGPSL